MINCTLLNFNEKNVFDNIVSEKYNPGKTTLENIKNRVKTSYDQYINNFNSLETKPYSDILKSEVKEKEALLGCYTSHTNTFRQIRGSIFNIQPDALQTLCPYCLLDEPTTLDHYIGEAEFPEYSVLIRNLIPSCYDCNQTKGTVWRMNKKRRYIHFYIDTFIAHRFLYAKLLYPSGSSIPRIHFYLSKPSSISSNDFRIIRSHFKDLKLFDSYKKRANLIIASEAQVLRAAKTRGESLLSIKTELINRSNSFSATVGPNFWHSSVYEAMGKSIKFLRSL